MTIDDDILLSVKEVAQLAKGGGERGGQGRLRGRRGHGGFKGLKGER